MEGGASKEAELRGGGDFGVVFGDRVLPVRGFLVGGMRGEREGLDEVCFFVAIGVADDGGQGPAPVGEIAFGAALFQREKASSFVCFFHLRFFVIMIC